MTARDADLLALIERLERGERTSRLERDIYRATGPHVAASPRNYFVSLDAAHTLIPDWCDFVEFRHCGATGCSWELSEIRAGEVHKRSEGSTEGEWAVALVIAALRASIIGSVFAETPTNKRKRIRARSTR